MKHLEQQICQLTGLSHSDYSRAMWDGALAYCQEYSYGKDLTIDCLLMTRSFWNWWRDVWQRADMEFMAQYSRYQNLNETEYMQLQWRDHHRSKNIPTRPGEDIVTECVQIMRAKAKEMLP